MFLPTTKKEVEALGWGQLEILIVTGDSYIDSPYIGAALIGRILVNHGFHVGIIAQPDVDSPDDIKRLGEPSLFWGVTSGSVDSMVANYTASKKRRKNDDYTPGGVNNKRPDRATIAYTNLIKKYFKKTCPIVLGGIEASLRRISHYDFWSDKIRRSILFDAKADFIIYGMAQKSIIDFSNAIKENKDVFKIDGIGYISKTAKFNELPSFEEVSKSKTKFIESFHTFYENNDPVTAKGISQKHGDRYINLNPPPQYPTTKELDQIYDLEFQRDLHPFYKKLGKVKALDTIQFSIPTHQGCYGQCNFCAISVHQGSTIRSRSEQSIINEAKIISKLESFKGYILDLGGPTANMYGFECEKKLKKGICKDKRCLFPTTCSSLKPDHARQLKLLKKLEKIKGVKKVFIGSGIRYDLIIADKKNGKQYLLKIVSDHVSGQMKIAPEHTQEKVLKLMGKPYNDSLLEFKEQFDYLSKRQNKKQFLTYYFIAAHPGCTFKDMKKLKEFINTNLKMNPEQVQIFTPSPSTYSTLMYYTGLDPYNNKALFVEKNLKEKTLQKNLITDKRKKYYNKKNLSRKATGIN